VSQYTNRAEVPSAEAALNPHGGHMWNPPGVSEGVGLSVPAGTGDVQLLGAVGNWCNYEVWIDVPNAWLEVVCSLELKTGGVVLPLDSARPVDMENLATLGAAAGILGRADEPGRLRGLLFSCYGRPAYGQLSVSARRRSAELQGGNLTDGRIYIRMWGTEGSSVGDRVGRPIVDQWGTRRQQRSYTRTLLADETEAVIVPAAAALPRAFHITDLVAVPATIDAVNPLQLHQRETVDTLNLTPVLRARAPSVAPIVVDLSFPWTGQRGYSWIVSRAGAVVWDITVNGFEE
jgi:hypothetical protein